MDHSIREPHLMKPRFRRWIGRLSQHRLRRKRERMADLRLLNNHMRRDIGLPPNER